MTPLDRAKATLTALQNEPLVRLALVKVGQLACHHAWVLCQSKHRLYLRCPTCQRETVGFTVGESA